MPRQHTWQRYSGNHLVELQALLGNETQMLTAMTPAEKLAIKSNKFHGFEWLRREALKGNRHANVMMEEIIRLREIKLYAAKAIKEFERYQGGRYEENAPSFLLLCKILKSEI